MLRSAQTLAAESTRIDGAIQAQRRTLAQLYEESQRAEGFLRRFFERPKRQIDADITQIEAALPELHHELADANRQVGLANQKHREMEQECRQLAGELAHVNEAAQRREFARLEQAERMLADEIQQLEKQISQLHGELIRNARIVGVTGTRAYLSVRDISPMDLVIIDEASMLPLPVVWFIAGMASTRAVVCGDFRQLPPIVDTDNPAIAEHIGADVFNAAGVSRLDPNDRRIVMLDTQRRMQPAICDLISGPMYGGRLRSFDGADFWARRNAQPKPPEPLSATLTIVDTSQLYPIESVDANRSRFNLLHALLTRNIAWHMKQRDYLNDSKRLAIITPYRAQVNLARTLLADAGIEYAQVGTVHAFQGDERHTIVVDIPESEGATGQAGRLIRGSAPNDLGARLINVAVSRAQNHLIVVANLAYLDRILPTSSMLRAVLCAMQTAGTVVQAAELLSRGPAGLEGLDGVDIKTLAREYGLFDQTDFDAALATDLGRARRSIAIFSGFIAKRRTLELTDALQARIQAGVRARCITRPPHRNLPNTAIGRDALDKLESIGCAVDCRVHIHQKVVIIDGHIVWHGSLNALSYSQYADELMTRTLGRGFAQMVAALLAKKRVPLEKVLDVITDAENPRCGSCGKKIRTFIDSRKSVEEFFCERFCGWSEPLSGERKHSARRSRTPAASVPTETGPAPCPECGAPLVERQGPYGRFLGCSTFPRCTGKARISSG
ncbi:AAA domain-containing protein [Steroidobacter agaridevorans]|nr:AAA domain-containing protein [Steroidobacter agaridevorans]